jgi:peptidoglycan/LPS O-acetylase OafA/YrhL
MKALLSTTLLLSAVTLAAVALAAVTLAGVILAASPGFAADVAIPRNFVAPEFQGGVAPNRLDVYDLRREMARDAEHDRIHTRLGDPVRWCRPAGVPGQPGLVIACR